MATRNIVVEGDPILSKKCREIDKFDLRLSQLIDDMFETLAKTGNGVGLAAPQVGMLKRVFVIDFEDKKYEFVNPVITSKSGEVLGQEGCLSCPGQYGMVKRAKEVTIEFCDRQGKRKKIKAEDFLARIIQHEYEHLEGVLFKQRAERMLTPEELGNE